MTKIEIELHDDVVTILNKIKDINDTGIELELPPDAIISENIVNLKLIKTYAERLDKIVHFVAFDKRTENLLAMLEDLPEQEELIQPVQKKKFKLPSIQLPTIKRMPSFNIKDKKLPIIGALVVITLIIYILLGRTLPKANINVVVNSQPLTRSLAIKVFVGKTLSTTDKTIPGLNLEALADASIEIETTGEKQVGEQAKGKVKIFNKTAIEKAFKKNTELYSDDLVFKLEDDVTIPAAAPQDPNDPGSPIIPGESEVEVRSEGFGEQYNIKSGETLEVEDEEKSDFEAKVTSDLTGGSSKTVKVVAKADITKAQEDIKAQINEIAKNKLMDKVANTQRLVNGSETNTLVTETFSHKEGEETDKLVLNQTVSTKALVYNQNDLEKIMEELTKELVPQDFELSQHDNNLSVDILGNTENTKLTLTEADLQVTLKTYVVPQISEEKLKEDLIGKSQQEAARILSEIRNINTYEINISPTMPFFRNIPSKVSNINLSIEKA